MNPQLDLRYRHTYPSRVLQDVRSKPAPEIAPEHCYFLGFRIAIAHDYQYRHALILADDYAAFVRGIRGECDTILSQSLARYASDIALVFVRNMEMLTPAMLDLVARGHIRTDTERALSRRDDNRFTLLGQRGNSVTLMSIQTSDALAAIEQARNQSAHLSNDALKPLEVLQAHPVTREFDALFQTTAKRMQCLIGSALCAGERQH